LELLILHDQGKLSFDDSAKKFFPDLNISPEITLEMLASQMSGIGRDRALNPLPANGDMTNFVAGTCGGFGYGCTKQQFLEVIGRDDPVFQSEIQASCTSPYQRNF
jgi:CubicO group peptidase (beta-lactamase class C family)